MQLDDLNAEQRDAVTRTDGPLMILAGAGTGKTRVITYRIAYMLGSGIPASQIVALSFTNKAAREMSGRVKDLVGARAKDVWLGTFHSFCLNILRRHAQAAGLSPGFGLAGTSDQLELVRKGLEEKNWAGLYQADQIHFQIGIAKNQLLSPEDIRRGEGRSLIHGDLPVLAEVYALYERQLRLHRVIDFDDCIYRTVRLLRESAEVRAALRRRYRYLMVDEYQDTNAAQLAVLELLASDTHDVCVVGDDDQSIYSWRGAMYEVLERFEQMFPGTHLIKLEQNYRCSNVILGAANTVIKNNKQRKDKTLWSASQETAPIVLTACEDERAEANLVAEKCLTLLGGGLANSDIAVLYRANNQAKDIELALREARIAYRTFGGQSFFERKEVKDFISYVRLVLDTEDRLALWRVINTPNRGIGIKTLEKIEGAAQAQSRSPWAVIRAELGQAPAGEGSAPAGAKSGGAVAQFAELISQFTALPLLTSADFEALGVAILKQSGLENDVRVRTEDSASRDRKLANLRSLPQWLAQVAADLQEKNGDGAYIDPRELLDTLTLDNDRRDEKETGKNHVSLMTIHASKGLEFPAVFVIGLEEELLPHKNSIQDPRAICEERRLFYVAVTRAKKKLFLSHCLGRSSGYQGAYNRTPSRFLQEVPATCMQRSDEAASVERRKETETERKVQTAQRLGALRGSFGATKRP